MHSLNPSINNNATLSKFGTGRQRGETFHSQFEAHAAVSDLISRKEHCTRKFAQDVSRMKDHLEQCAPYKAPKQRVITTALQRIKAGAKNDLELHLACACRMRTSVVDFRRAGNEKVHRQIERGVHAIKSPYSPRKSQQSARRVWI